jgi:hypothetical protein
VAVWEEETDKKGPLVTERGKRVRNMGVDDMWVHPTFRFKSHSYFTKRSSAFHTAAFPQFTTAFAKATTQPNTPKASFFFLFQFLQQ